MLEKALKNGTFRVFFTFVIFPVLTIYCGILLNLFYILTLSAKYGILNALIVFKKFSKGKDYVYCY